MHAPTAKPGRLIIALMVVMLALAVVLNYVDRGAIGIAAPLMTRSLGLSPLQFGFAASAFFWTYGVAQPFVGMVADRWSAGRVLAVSIALWAMATLLTSLVAGLAMLVMLRLMLGLGEAALFPVASKLIAQHVPQARRGLANSVVSVGLALGPAIGSLAGGLILARYGWRWVFFGFGLATLVWLVPWLVLGTQLPQTRQSEDALRPSAIRALLSRRTLWVMGVAHALANYAFFFVTIWLPTYLIKSRGLTIPTMTLFATATFAAQAVASMGWGQLADWLVRRGGQASAVKRWLSVVAELGSIAGIAGIALAPGPGALLAALIVTGVFLGCLPTMVFALGQIHAGARDAAGWIGVQSGIGSLSGVIGPIVTGMIVDMTGSFSGAFAFAGLVCAAGAAVFAFVVP